MALPRETNPRVAIRMRPELKKRIEEAAGLMGLTVTDFVVSTLSERASEVLERQQRMTLSDSDRDRLLAALGRPGRVIPELADTLDKHGNGPSS